LVCVVGARPNFIKMAAVWNELSSRPLFRPLLIHTGQHYSPGMSDTFFEQLELPRPDVNLEVGAGTQIEQTAEIMRRLEPLLLAQKPRLLIVVGDVNSTLAAALAASKLLIPIAHIEAGLRSFDRTMPEELNRVVTDALSDFLFVTEPSGLQNLRGEGIPDDRIFFCGNVMIDTLLRFRPKAATSTILSDLGLKPSQYAVSTIHRASNVDDPERLAGLISVLRQLSTRIPVVFPVHPRTRQKLEANQIDVSGICLTPPLGYLDFLQLNANARMVLTDSGGIQEESTILQVPCLTMRENTERPVTVEQGTNRLVGIDPAGILPAAMEVLDRPTPLTRIPELWDGKASIRIADVLETKFT
jgi:UDP-N-acetylglucosamine 2-epimerase (non-hydrolysing)